MKKKSFIRICSLVLAISLLLTAFPLAAFAENVVDNTVQDESDVDINDTTANVENADQLEAALEAGTGMICIAADFKLDRTFYVTTNTIIFSTEAHTLTRDADFNGDIFVIGETSDGALCENTVTLILGDSADTTENLLVIDGNKDNLNVDVVGSALFLTKKAVVNIYSGITFTNHKKVGNSKTNGGYSVSYPVRIGGSVAIITGSAKMNIYGGNFTNNTVNTVSDSEDTATQGGVIYNYGTLSVYGGNFEGNSAHFGGVFFNYRTMNIYKATISNNTASSLGGAIYIPNSGSAFTYIGDENITDEPTVVFRGNSSKKNGGAIYSRNHLSIKNAVFEGNSSTTAYGGAIYASTVKLSISGSVFTNNTATEEGGALYISGTNSSEDILELTVSDTLFSQNTSKIDGGAVYLSNSARAYFKTSDFLENTAVRGGAIFTTGATLEIDESTLSGNTTTSTGGAIAAYENSNIVLKLISASENTGSSGGAVYVNASNFTLYGSEFFDNTATSAGGALNLNASSVSNIYGTKFEGNSSGNNAGAVAIYTNTTDAKFYDCEFIGNTANNYGGGIHTTTKSQVHLYNIIAKNNSAPYGGFMYETLSGTVVTIAGLTVSGNTATTGGPIIWGNTANAKLYIDKSKYVDLDEKGDWDSAYWAEAIKNKLTVIEKEIEIPSYTDYDNTLIIPVPPIVPSKVETPAQLERALRAGHQIITIIADFDIDRTFYINYNVKIVSDGIHTLTRKADFAGDIFVIGEVSNGVLSENEVEFTLGNENPNEENALIIDGNKANTTVDVVGTALFLTKMATVNIYGDVTFTNHKKVGNEKTSNGYTVSYPVRIGGSVAIITEGATMNIFGGSFTNNEANTVSDDQYTAIQGGAFYNYGTFNIYGGNFEGNTAYFGGVFFNYRTMNIYKAVFRNNTATDIGGVMYIPNSGSAFTYIGEENDTVVPEVLFEGNTSKDVGGAIYARNKIVIKNSTFKNNSSTADSGGAIAGNTVRMTIENCLFEENSASAYGGAIFVTGANSQDEVELKVLSSVFNKNSANRAGAVYVTTDAEAYIFKSNFTENTATYGGVSFVETAKLEINNSLMTSNSATYAGCIEVYTNSTVLLNNITTDNNSASHGGFAYVKEGDLSIYNSKINNNESTSAGGAINFNTSATAKIYATSFNDNTAGTNGGAFAVYTGGTEIMVHGSEFIGNSATGYGGAVHITTKGNLNAYNITAKNNSAGHGGFLYETVTGAVCRIAGLTVSGNTATTGGPIIWGNSTGAKLYMDTEKYSDLDHSGEYDSAYWKTAIVNKLTVDYTYSAEAPKYLDYGNESYDQMADAVDVKNADELESAINSGAKHIRIIADFELDRTFYMTREIVIFSTIERTLTRAKDFSGDIFVVGEDKDGKSALLIGKGAKLTLGNPYSVKVNLLTIDGNKDNMEVNVDGTVLFVCYGSIINLQSNVTIQNCEKVANKRVENTVYKFSTANRIGGSVAIVANGTINIYNATIKNNNVNFATSEFAEGKQNCVNGGAIYNEGTVNIYGGNFIGNSGGRGGFLFNYAIARIISGNIEGNTSGTAGGAIYVSNTTATRLFVGTSAEGLDKVIIKNNSSGTSGGAIYAPYYAAVIIYGNTEFIGNHSETTGGAIVSYGAITIRNTLFSENTASSGGAVYASNTINSFKTRFTVFENCIFEKNSANSGGALMLYSSDSTYKNGALVTVSDCEFNENTAASGGAIYTDRKSELNITNSNFNLNSATGEAGAIYASGESKTTISNSNVIGSSAGKAGGAFSVRSAYFTVDNCLVDQSNSVTNGGAIYVSYNSNSTMNTKLNIANSTFTNNVSGGYGGVIYATRHEIDKEHKILDISNTLFEGNTANDDGGAIHLQTGVEAYLKEVTFNNNTATTGEGGAISTPGAIIEIDTATFNGNASKGVGGAISLNGTATATLNNITALSNKTGASGGFIYNEGSTLKLYNSIVKGNSADTNGGAIAFYSDAVSEVYNTSFEENSSLANGGALTVYTGGTETIVNTATFKGNSAASGGGIYISGSSDLKLYNITATNNTATKGGFMYETTTGTVVKLNGIVLGGNTATTGGPIIWGNSTGAKLNINKVNYTDLDNTGAYDSEYWAAAIYNKLTVKEISESIPTYKDYVPAATPKPETPTEKPVVSVDAIFELAEKQTNEGDINSIYGKFPKLENTSNFMSKGQTVFENINGETVTVDSFVYPPYAAADNVNVGQGLMIFQAMQYKKAFPAEEVYIDISSYRFSVQSAVNINRNSRYFGYMRNLSGVQYDEYGFVRIAYLLVCAAKMGIHVNIVPHVDGYPTTSGELKIDQYFTSRFDEPCDPAYVSGEATVSDYLDFNKVAWTLGSDGNKGGTDMMHTKLCAVSHYLDKDGVAHKNAVYTSSANLDGINSKGYNGNWALQTATIISDHEEIYNVSVNYLRLMANYTGQDEIYEFQDIMNTLTTEQAELINQGKANEIPKEEKLIYLGTENDDVFEMYFTPLGGDILNWDEVNNPWCKYLRKMYNSEDYISFVWNAAEYSSFDLLKQMEDMIVEAFHNNRNPKNYAYGLMESFDGSRFDDLVVGEDIGFKSFNKHYFGGIHNKDLHVSYTENGQRYYVSVLNSCNVHGGSMYYQSNFALVIKETTCSEDSVFATITKHSAPGQIIEHNYSEEIFDEEATQTEHGYKYKKCVDCGHKYIYETYHTEGEWHNYIDTDINQNGLKYNTCIICDKILKVKEFALTNKTEIDVLENQGKKFSQYKLNMLPTLSGSPTTLEAVIKIPKTQSQRVGVIVGNYKGNSREDCINLEVFTLGRVRLYFINNRVVSSCLFNTDIRGDEARHIAVTVDGTVASLYVDGKLTETQVTKTSLPNCVNDFAIGGDLRVDNAQYFKEEIFSVNLFSDVRTSEEISVDTVYVPGKCQGLVYSKYFKESDITENLKGEVFGKETILPVNTAEISMPKTFEAIISLPETVSDRGGVIVGNFNKTKENQFNFEVYTDGKIRLYSVFNGKVNDCVFDTDIRSNGQKHIAVTLDDTIATLYVDGKFAESKTLAYALPDTINNLLIGNDNRSGHARYFRGKIYSVNLYSNLRTAEEILQDSKSIPNDNTTLVFSKFFIDEGLTKIEGETLIGSTFTDSIINEINRLASTPKTFEAIIKVPTDYSGRAGAVISNYGADTDNSISIEIYSEGKVRLYIVNNAAKIDCTFSEDIRSSGPVHIAVTVDGLSATLYVNGKQTETKQLTVGLPDTTEKFAIGGDWRYKNTQYFKGTIYAVNMFSDVRTDEEIKADMYAVKATEDALVYSNYYSNDEKLSGFFGQTFSENIIAPINSNLRTPPKTFEATIQVPKTLSQRAGIIIGSYGDYIKNAISFEISTGGKVKIYSRANGLQNSYVFNADIRSDIPKHIAVTVDGTVVTLYVDGVLTETGTITIPMVESTKECLIGGDHRTNNEQYFKGTIYSVSLFSDIRTQEEIIGDMITTADQEDLLFSSSFTKQTADSFINTTNHDEGKIILDSLPTDDTNGIAHINCNECGKTVTVIEYSNEVEEKIVFDTTLEDNYINEQKYSIPDGEITKPIKTYEFLMQLDSTNINRSGVLLGNYISTGKNVINFEIYTNGNPRLYYVVNGTAYSLIFNADIRSEDLTSLIFTVDGLNVSLYVNGKFVETKTLSVALPAITDGFNIGGDNRADNSQLFKGKIYAVNLFSDIRTAEEIKQDSLWVATNTDKLIYSKTFENVENGGNSQEPTQNSLEGKTIVNFGDSIFGNYKAPEDISTFIAEKTKATVYNVGFGSCQMSEHSTEKYNAFSMEKLADAITTGNFELQDSIIAGGDAPVAFTRCLETLKSINFNNVDIITIAYGTNDFKNGKSLEDVMNAAKYSIETIQNAFPHIEIVLCTPVYRYWLDENGNFLEDSETMEINGILLTDYIGLYTEICEEYGLFMIDNYNNSGINATNRDKYFDGTDTTHPNLEGRKLIAENMAKRLCSYFG